MIVAGWDSIYRIDPAGNVNKLCFTRSRDQCIFSIKRLTDENGVGTGKFAVEVGTASSPVRSALYRFTPPDNFEWLSSSYTSPMIDKTGNFYKTFYENSTPRTYGIARLDDNFAVEEVVVSGLKGIGSFTFDDSNNLYFLESNSPASGYSMIWKVTAGADKLPGPSDPRSFVFQLPYLWYLLAVDDSGGLYASRISGSVQDLHSNLSTYEIVKIDPWQNRYDTVASGIGLCKGLEFRDGYLYVADLDNAVILKIDSAGATTNFTADHGLGTPTTVLLGADDRLYTTDFRHQSFVRINEDGTFDKISGTGYSTSNDADDQHIYLGSLSGTDGKQRLLKFDALTTAWETIVPGGQFSFRNIDLDSFGRIGSIGSAYPGPGNQIFITDPVTWETKPYVRGLSNLGRGFRFDSKQNLYVKQGFGEGIKKIHLEYEYPEPLDISLEPYFLDFRNGQSDSPPTEIGFFWVNDLEDLYVPLVDSGRILKADKIQNVQVLAEGFVRPYYVSVDRYGRMYVADWGNGIFEITSVSLEISCLEELVQEILGLNLETLSLLSGPDTQDSAMGSIVTSLIQKLNNAIGSLERQNKNAAIKIIAAFQHEVRAQRGKKIPVEVADRWLKTTQGIIQVLQQL
jgi:hypothetical protein